MAFRDFMNVNNCTYTDKCFKNDLMRAEPVDSIAGKSETREGDICSILSRAAESVRAETANMMGGLGGFVDYMDETLMAFESHFVDNSICEFLLDTGASISCVKSPHLVRKFVGSGKIRQADGEEVRGGASVSRSLFLFCSGTRARRS